MMRRGLAVLAVTVWVVSLILLVSSAHAASGCQDTVAHPRWCAKVAIVGHRGGHGPNENTLLALRSDQRWGAQFETDQWNTADGVPVIMHDPTLRRTVDPASMPPGVTPQSRPGDLTIVQWQQLRTFGGEPLPTLYQWIRHAQRWGVPGMVEVKYGPVHPDQVAAWVKASTVPITFYASPNLVGGRCTHAPIQRMRAVGMTIGLKARSTCPVTWEQAKALGYSYVITTSSLLTPSEVTHAHSVGLKVGDYLAGSVDVWRMLVSARVDYLLVPYVRPAQRWR